MAPKKKGTNGVSQKKTQLEVPGTEHPDDVEAIDDAMADYLNARAAVLRMKQGQRELKAAVLALMKEHKRQKYVYRDGGYRYTFSADGTVELHVKREADGAKKKRGKAAAAAAEATETAP
jgi:hypothetical protein